MLNRLAPKDLSTTIPLKLPLRRTPISSAATEVAAEPSARSKPDTTDNGDREITTLAKAGTSGPTLPVEKAEPPIENAKPFSRIAEVRSHLDGERPSPESAVAEGADIR
jgi:hypothetical protein